MLKLDEDSFPLIADTDKGIICMEKFIAVIKGEESESEDSYLFARLLVDTIGKLNIFMTSYLNMNSNPDKEIDGPKSKEEAFKELEEKVGNVNKEELEDKFKDFLKKGEPKKDTNKKIRYSK